MHFPIRFYDYEKNQNNIHFKQYVARLASFTGLNPIELPTFKNISRKPAFFSDDDGET